MGWRVAHGKSADFVNQPNNHDYKQNRTDWISSDGHAMLWVEPVSQIFTTHRITWQAGRIDFLSYPTGKPNQAFKSFTVTDKVPLESGMLLHLNLWMYTGRTKQKTTQDKVEVVVSGFSFNGAGPSPCPPVVL